MSRAGSILRQAGRLYWGSFKRADKFDKALMVSGWVFIAIALTALISPNLELPLWLILAYSALVVVGVVVNAWRSRGVMRAIKRESALSQAEFAMALEEMEHKQRRRNLP